MEMEMSITPKTYRQVTEARIERSRRDYAVVAEQKRIASVLAANPAIGVLVRNGKPKFYVSSPMYREATDPAALVGQS
jgi:hypothetical protein